MKEEKKVEFIELIYDLIFVYLIGRNASLLDRIEDGFISAGTFVYYLVSSLIILQIWNYTTLFINRFGKNSFSDKVMLLINMFLLYIIGANTLHGWEGSYLAFMGAWCLILLNLAVQYLLKLRSAENELCRRVILQNVILLVLQAVIIGVSIPVHAATGVAFGQWAVLLSIAAVPVLSKIPANFGHLTERVMLYVVFTFGEMVIIVAEYFADGLSFETLYFALASFLIVAGLFFSYGYVYDRLLDRSGERSGSGYMLLHVFIVLSLSCVTTSMDPEGPVGERVRRGIPDGAGDLADRLLPRPCADREVVVPGIPAPRTVPPPARGGVHRFRRGHDTQRGEGRISHSRDRTGFRLYPAGHSAAVRQAYAPPRAAAYIRRM